MKTEIKKKWDDLHVKLVNEVITFCKENKLEASEFHLSADCLEPSIEKGEWCPYTDSCFSLLKRDINDDYKLKDILTSI
ncbi:MAG: hypothetical protein K2H20_02270 [Bacilli bacterium]|nr:hypothetical protein [Bacilli bacterium]